MQSLKVSVRNAVGAGTLASLASSVALVVCGWAENDRGLATHNGPSQWIFGKPAAARRRLDLRHTLVGYLIHHASSVWWAVVHQQLAGTDRRPTLGRSLAEGLAISAAACVVDYRLTPGRFQPGFEKHVSRRSLGIVYLLFGLGLGAGHFLVHRRR